MRSIPNDTANRATQDICPPIVLACINALSIIVIVKILFSLNEHIGLTSII